MIEEVTRYQTNDGELHTSNMEARAHIVSKLADVVGPIIDKASSKLPVDHGLTTKAKLAVVDELVGSIDAAILLQKALNRLLG